MIGRRRYPMTAGLLVLAAASACGDDVGEPAPAGDCKKPGQACAGAPADTTGGDRVEPSPAAPLRGSSTAFRFVDEASHHAAPRPEGVPESPKPR